MKRDATLRFLFNLQSGKCAYCKIEMDLSKTNADNAPTKDHILPKSKYPKLKRDKNNMVCACLKCNQEKGDMPVDIFLAKKVIK